MRSSRIICAAPRSWSYWYFWVIFSWGTDWISYFGLSGSWNSNFWFLSHLGFSRQLEVSDLFAWWLSCVCFAYQLRRNSLGWPCAREGCLHDTHGALQVTGLLNLPWVAIFWHTFLESMTGLRIYQLSHSIKMERNPWVWSRRVGWQSLTVCRYEGEWFQNLMQGHGVIEVDIPVATHPQALSMFLHVFRSTSLCRYRCWVTRMLVFGIWFRLVVCSCSRFARIFLTYIFLFGS